MKYKILTLIPVGLLLVGCSTVNAPFVGSFPDGGVVYFTPSKIAANRYSLTAKGAPNITKRQLVVAYKHRAMLLCRPGKMYLSNIRYQVASVGIDRKSVGGGKGVMVRRGAGGGGSR